MRPRLSAAFLAVLMIGIAGCGGGTDDGGNGKKPEQMGTEEFGLSKRELHDACEKVEALIAKCMREQGFEYVAADYQT